MVLALVAGVKLVMADVPPIFKVAPEPLVKVLAPARAVETVSVPLLVVVPEMVKLGIATALAPLMVLVVPLKV